MVIQKYMGEESKQLALVYKFSDEWNSGVAFGKDGVIHFYVKNQYDCRLWYF